MIGQMRAVIDTSSLISLAWAGQLELLRVQPLDLVILDAVHGEAVVDGRARGHVDATAIEQAIRDLARVPDPQGATVDERVVAASAAVGVMIANDQVIGRRVQNLGARWLRTADLVVLADSVGGIDRKRARGAIQALHGTGRITDELRSAYLAEMP